MKKLILSLAMIAAGTAAFAQISSGTLMMGGSLGFNSGGGGTRDVTPANNGTKTSTDLTASSNWNFSPAIGYFLSDKIAVGVRLNVGSDHLYQITTADGKTTENVASFNLGVELFGRYYKELGSNVYMFLDAGLGYSSMSYTDRVQDGTDKLKDDDKNSTTAIGINIAPGITYFPTAKWGIDLTLNRLIGYNMYNSTVEAPNNGRKIETSTSDFGIGLGLMPSLGLHYYMGK